MLLKVKVAEVTEGSLKVTAPQGSRACCVTGDLQWPAGPVVHVCDLQLME